MQAPRHILDLLKIPWVRIGLEALGILACLWILARLSGVLTPVGIGLALAYMVEPLVSWLERKRIARRYAAGAVFGGGALLLALLALLAIPIAWTEGLKLYRVGFQGDTFIDSATGGQDPNGLWDTGETLTRDLNGNGRFDFSQMQVLENFLVAKGWLSRGQEGLDLPSTLAFDPDQWLREEVSKLSAEDGKAFFSRIASFFGGLGYWALFLLLVPVYAYFFSLHLQAVSQQVVGHIPSRQRERTLRILSQINLAVGAFFRGRLAVCAILGIIACIGFGISGVPSFIAFGLLMGLATAIPLASGLVLVPVAMLLYLGGAETWQFIAAAVTYLVVQGCEPLLITLIMGKGVEMHPVLIVVAILAFGTLLGGVGVLLAVPLAATARILFREFVYPQLRRIAGLDETPPSMLGDDPTLGA